MISRCIQVYVHNFQSYIFKQSLIFITSYEREDNGNKARDENVMFEQSSVWRSFISSLMWARKVYDFVP